MDSLKPILNEIELFLHNLQILGVVDSFNLSLSEKDCLWSTEIQETYEKFRNSIINCTVDSSKTEKHNSEVVENVCSISPENEDSTAAANDNKTCQMMLKSNKELVQIQVNVHEIQRRISAFMSWKRKEVEECNVQEFCSRPYVNEKNPIWDQIDSCSRVDSVFIPRFGNKGHYKVSRVENRYDPKRHVKNESANKSKKEDGSDNLSHLNETCIETIQERLQNMESHLKLKTESSLRSSIIQRLKKLEDRILFLEGLSPDYFQYVRPSFKSPKKKSHHEKEKLYANCSVYELQKRIQTLKETLKCKSSQIKKENFD